MSVIKVEDDGAEMIILKEPMMDSIVADVVGYGVLWFSFWFNYNYIGGSYLVNAIILIVAVIKILKIINPKKRYSIDEAIDQLEALRKAP